MLPVHTHTHTCTDTHTYKCTYTHLHTYTHTPIHTPTMHTRNSPVYSQQQKPDEVQQGLHERRPALDGRVLLRVRCEHHRRAAFVFQTEKPGNKNILVSRDPEEGRRDFYKHLRERCTRGAAMCAGLGQPLPGRPDTAQGWGDSPDVLEAAAGHGHPGLHPQVERQACRAMHPRTTGQGGWRNLSARHPQAPARMSNRPRAPGAMLGTGTSLGLCPRRTQP